MIINYSLLLIRQLKKQNESIEALIISVIQWTLIAYLTVISLSLFKALQFGYVAGIYIIIDILLLLYLTKTRQICRDDYINALKVLRDYLWRKKRVFSDSLAGKVSILIQMAIIIYALGLGIVALLAVPYNYDSITYHAPRICQWVQHRTVAYYATHITRQNVSTVLVSYISTLMYILTGKSDHALCWLQYLSYVANLGLITYICNWLGLRTIYKRIVQALWVTLPIGFAEAITPMNDQFAAFWLLSFWILLMPLMTGEFTSGKETIIRICNIAFCIGFAYLTKPSVCIAMVVALFAYLLACIHRHVSVLELACQCICALPIILVLCLPGWINNYMMLGSIMADNVGARQLIGTLQPNYIVVNWLKNITYASTVSLGLFSNTQLGGAIVNGAASLFKVVLDDPSIAEDGTSFGYPSRPVFTSDAAINATTNLLFVLTIILFVFFAKKIRREYRQYISVSFISLLIFFALLRWEPSITRYLIGYYAFCLPAIGYILQILGNRINTKCLQIVLISIIACGISLEAFGELKLLVQIHPVFPVKSSFALYNDLMDDYMEITDYIRSKDCKQIGIIESETGVEYPLWTVIPDDVSIIHVNLTDDNASRIYEDMDSHPEIILNSRTCDDTMTCHGREYSRVIHNDGWSLFEINP